MYQVYQTINKVNNRYYIGVHKGDIYEDDYYGSGKLMRHALNKYGKKNFKRTVISEFKNETLALRFERFLVGMPVVNDRMSYNIVVGGGRYGVGESHPMYGMKRPPRSKEWKQKLSKAHSGENHPFYGKNRPEHSKLMSGENNPMKRPEVSKKLSGSGNGMYGVSPWCKGKKRPEHAKKLSKPVIQMDKDGNKIRVYESVKEAGNDVGVCSSAISQCISGRSKTSAGYKWKFANS